MSVATVPSRARYTEARYSCRRAVILAVACVAVGLAVFVQGSSVWGFSPTGEGRTAIRTAEFRGDPLSFEDRVRYQRRIEEVYWRHRIWPAENPNPKPAFEALFSDEAVREHVKTYLAKSVAMEHLWSRPATGEQLQAEMNRMVRDSRNPDLLRELIAALDDDPFLVAECLARPLLVDRLARNWYARESSERSFEAWWAEAGREMIGAAGSDRVFAVHAGGYELHVPLDGGGCTADTWSELWYVPTGREHHTAVWTGAEMIVWGGSAEDTGGRYDPATDTWTATSSGAGIPVGTSHHTAVWTGTEMIVWGGNSNTGGRYDPVTDAWTATSVGPGVPAPRSGHVAVWSGTEMIVWGGNSITGGRYDPVADSWTATSVGIGVPSPRDGFTAVWSGTEMIVWGGFDGDVLVNNGGRYDPATDSWTATSTGVNVPAERDSHKAIWTGTEMIVWGGADWSTSYPVYFNSGGRYDPVADSWTPTSTGPGVPSARDTFTALWTGTEMIVWGGTEYESGWIYYNTGGRYDPETDSWTATATGPGTPIPRRNHTAVWTGTEMIVWGGYDNAERADTGGRYDPVTDSWIPTSRGEDVPTPRRLHSAIWTGTEMIVWGGIENDPVNNHNYLDTGGRYDPATDNWTPTGVEAGLPAGRDQHTSVWTGTEMIVWGGRGPQDDMGWPVYWDSGGRYDPASDSWTVTSTGPGVPTERVGHTAVWTGSEMIVWGGGNGDETNTGGRYDPAEDRWTPTSTAPETPRARTGHQAVWTGTEMIVWGGLWGAGQGLSTGGRYDPDTDSWTATSVGFSARFDPTAVWTGTEMIVWGGLRTTVSQYYNTGGRYAPATDSWASTSTADGVPDGRWAHTAVWTGTDMIVWGGGNPQDVETGGRYDPAANGWTGTSTGEGAPLARSGHIAVWTGTAMIVWGGRGSGSFNSGGIYCACESDEVSTWYPDADGDGRGSDSTGVPSCSQPPGYIAVGGDCDDANADTYSDAPEINDGRDNQCPGDAGHGIIDEISGVTGFFNAVSRDEFSWPAQTGATSYEVARSTDGEFVTDCVTHVTTTAYWDDGTPVPFDSCSHYLVRATQPNVGSWGAGSDGVERTPVCP